MLFRFLFALGVLLHLPVLAAGALFRVSQGDQTAYLYGTVHVGRADAAVLAPQAAMALAKSSTLVLELDIRREAGLSDALARHGQYPRGRSLLTELDPQLRERLRERLARYRLTLEQVVQFKPWLIANLLVGLELSSDGFERPYGQDAVLLAQARRNAQIAELEDAESQLAMFDSMGAASSAHYLRHVLDGSASAEARELLEAWRTADASRLDALHARLTAGDSPVADFNRRLLLGQRNPAMADGIEKILRTSGTSFVGVGILHLLGAQGLPRLLAQRGYLVERIY